MTLNENKTVSIIMESTILLTPEQRSNMPLLLSYLQVNQLVFSQISNISQSVISNTILKKDRSMRTTTFRALLKGFRLLIIEKNSEFSNNELIIIESIYNKIEGKAIAAAIHSPGGILKNSALNYIHKHAKQELLLCLGDVNMSSILIAGGDRSGKSSLVGDFLTEVNHMKNNVLYADFSDMSECIDMKNLFCMFIQKIMRNPEENKDIDEYLEDCGEKLPREWAQDYISQCIRDSIHSKCILIIDGLDHESIKMEQINEFFEFILQMAHKKQSQYIKDLMVIATMNPSSYNKVSSHRLKKYSSIIQIENWSKQDVGELLAHYKIQNDSREDELYDLFGGQQALTHLGIHDLHVENNIENMREKAFRLRGAYGVFWQGWKKTLKALIKDHNEECDLHEFFTLLLSSEMKGEKKDLYNFPLIFDEPFEMMGISVFPEIEVKSKFLKNAMEFDLKRRR